MGFSQKSPKEYNSILNERRIPYNFSAKKAPFDTEMVKVVASK